MELMSEEIKVEEVKPAKAKSAKSTPKDYQCIHEVVYGDALWFLAEKYLGNTARWTEIMHLNNLPNARIQIGDKIKIPNR